MFLIDADAPIYESAKGLADYIENLAVLPDTDTITILGLSKCAVMSFYVPSFFTKKQTFEKTNIFNIAAPYTGTKLASPLIFYKEVEDLINAKIPSKSAAKAITNQLIHFYERISSNSHMDYDIAIQNGITENKKDFYDEGFIKNVFRQENIQAIQKINSFKNILTGIDKDTLKEAIKTGNMVGIGLCILNNLFFDNKSDGMVYVDAQRKVEDVLDIKSIQIKSAHHDVNSNTRVLKELLTIVDSTLEEQEKIKM